MPYLLTDLKVNRVDFVEEGANSAAFIELYKRKESDLSMTVEEIIAKLQPEHAAIVMKAFNDAKTSASDAAVAVATKETALVKAQTNLATAQAELAKANTEKATLTTALEEASKAAKKADDDNKQPFDETEAFKSMPAEARVLLIKMRSEKTAAEEALKKAKDAEIHATAVAKAATLKSIPLPMDELVEAIKTCPPNVVGMFEVINASINETIMQEVGKSLEGTAITAQNAWDRIEKEADKVATRDSISKQRAIAVVIQEQPALYKEYLKGGAN